MYDLYANFAPVGRNIQPFQHSKAKRQRNYSLSKITSTFGDQKSLTKQYSTLCKDSSAKKLSPPPSYPKNKHKHSFSYLQQQSSIDHNKTIANNQHISSAINSINNYSEELKTTVIGKQKSNKRLPQVNIQKHNSEQKISERVMKEY